MTEPTIQPNDTNDSKPPVDAQTRAGRIASGDLIEAFDDLAQEAGLWSPVAFTRAAWEDCVAWSYADKERKGIAQSETGRLWYVLSLANAALTETPRTHRRVPIHLVRIPRERRIRKAYPATLIVSVSIEDGEEVITISLPSET
ncbi:hypothetical protein [Planomonospora algeriensis]